MQVGPAQKLGKVYIPEEDVVYTARKPCLLEFRELTLNFTVKAEPREV